MDPLQVLLGVAVGLLSGWLIARGRGRTELRQAEAAAAEARSRAETAAAERTRSDAELGAVRAALSEAEKGRAGTEATLASERRLAEEKAALLSRAESALREAFAALSSDALKSNNQAFIDLAKAAFAEVHQSAKGDLDARQVAIDTMLQPVRESLGKVDTTLQALEKSRAEAYGSLRQQLTSLADTQAKLKDETGRLVSALKKPQGRGRWGEIQLKNVVEMAGMLDHCDFHEQVSIGDDGAAYRPDLVVRLPGGKCVVVDAKAVLDGYLGALEAPDDAARQVCLQAHARHVRDHMTKLSAKSYWDKLPAAPEFVVMFLPGEAFFSAALQEDPSLIELGVAKRVIPASPVTLVALLRAVAYGWTQERIAENAQRISDLGRDLYDRIAKVGEHFARVGSGLTTAVGAYNEAVTSMESRVLVTARRFPELGVPESRPIDELKVVEKTPRELQAPELKPLPRSA